MERLLQKRHATIWHQFPEPKWRNLGISSYESQAMGLLLRNGMKVHTLLSDEKDKQLQAMRLANLNYSNRAKKQQQMIAAVKKKTSAKSTLSK